jgi:single-stranded-DNA-specific exonuclease
VIVTVDCGSTSLPEIGEARAAGIDVLVTDHHRVPPELPAAVAVVNPQRADSTYPERKLAGSGVAFKLAQLLLADEPGGPAAALELADLADDRLHRRPRPDPSARRGRSSVSASTRLRATRDPGSPPSSRPASVAPRGGRRGRTLSFAVAPRINAAGRIGETRPRRRSS